VIIANHMPAEGEIVLDQNELAGFKEVPAGKLLPWDLGTGAAVHDFLEQQPFRPIKIEHKVPIPAGAGKTGSRHRSPRNGYLER
jgi:hypothetical protein